MAKKAKKGGTGKGFVPYTKAGANFKKAQKSGMKGKMTDSVESLESVK